MEPVVRTVRVNAEPKRAFEIFVGSIGKWWPADHHIGETAFSNIVIEPKTGGRFYEVGQDGAECEWGRVLAYEPGERLVLAWQLNADWDYDPDFGSEVHVLFTSAGDQTEVRLEHRNLEAYGERAPEIVASIGSENGWTGILQSFLEQCAVAEGH